MSEATLMGLVLTAAALPVWMLLRLRKAQQAGTAQETAFREGLAELARPRCPDCNSPRRIRPRRTRYLCLDCGSEAGSEAIDAELARSQVRQELVELNDEDRVTAAREELGELQAYLTEALDRAREVPGFVSLDYLNSYSDEEADWEDRDRAGILRAVFELIGQLDRGMSLSADLVDGVEPSSRPVTFDAERWAMEALRKAHVKRVGSCTDIKELVVALDELQVPLQEHAALLRTPAEESSSS